MTNRVPGAPDPPEKPAPMRFGQKPKRWYHEWTRNVVVDETESFDPAELIGPPPKREPRPRPPRRWRIVMALLPWRYKMRLLNRWAER